MWKPLGDVTGSERNCHHKNKQHPNEYKMQAKMLAMVRKDYTLSSPMISGNNLNVFKCLPLLQAR